MPVANVVVGVQFRRLNKQSYAACIQCGSGGDVEYFAGSNGYFDSFDYYQQPFIIRLVQMHGSPRIMRLQIGSVSFWRGNCRAMPV